MSLKDILNHHGNAKDGRANGIIVPGKASGSQYAKTPLLAGLAEMLKFSIHVSDFLLSPIIANKTVADAIAVTHANHRGFGETYLIVLRDDPDRQDNPEPLETDPNEAWPLVHGSLSVISKEDIETVLLKNIQHLNSFRAFQCDPQWPTMQAIYKLLNNGPKRSQEVKTSLINIANISAADAQKTINWALLHSYILCDLTVPLNDSSVIRNGTAEDYQNDDLDPVIAVIKRGLCSKS